VKYPVVYNHGHFPATIPGARQPQPPPPPGPQPRAINVWMQHPSPYYDDSYGVNSANNGPFGDAIMQELIPLVESKFRIIREPWARMLTGGSTGGWIALGASSLLSRFLRRRLLAVSRRRRLPLPPDRQHLRRRQRLLRRSRMGEDRTPEQSTARRQHRVDDERRELVRARAGRSLALGRPVGHLGSDVWSRRSRRISAANLGQVDGKINKDVAAYWKEHYDLRHILESRWATLGPKLAHKINVYVGDADSYFLNMGVHLLDEFLRKADNPKWTGEIVFQPMAPHCWGPPRNELAAKMAAQDHEVRAAGLGCHELEVLMEGGLRPAST
jgi:hypothetical protein